MKGKAEGPWMRKHTKCPTSLQKRTRKAALSACARAMQTLESIDVSRVDPDIAMEHRGLHQRARSHCEGLRAGTDRRGAAQRYVLGTDGSGLA